MPDLTYRATGLRDLRRDLKAMSRDIDREFGRELKRVAEPVAADARALATRFGPNIARTIAAGQSRGGAVVRQRARKTTGRRPDFGGLQMRTVLSPALERNASRVYREAERLIDRFARQHGFH